MASIYVNTGGEVEEVSSPGKRRNSNSPTCANNHHNNHEVGPRCVCAPPTHAGSFKCRLHRSNSVNGGSQSPSSTSPTSSTLA